MINHVFIAPLSRYPDHTFAAPEKLFERLFVKARELID
jgi:hypothetical protein